MNIRCGHCKHRHLTTYDVYLCSIGRTAAQPRMAAAQPSQSWQPSLVTPLAMIKIIRDGRYAVRPDSETPYTFVRVHRPKNGRKKGCLVIQTQHSDWYKDCILIYPNDRVVVIDKRVDSSLLLIVTDPITASMAYGRELGVCCSCGRELTDERSRWYGIGPECEKRFPEIINRVNEKHGHAYYPGCGE